MWCGRIIIFYLSGIWDNKSPHGNYIKRMFRSICTEIWWRKNKALFSKKKNILYGEQKRIPRTRAEIQRSKMYREKTTNACQSKVDMSTQQKYIVETHEKWSQIARYTRRRQKQWCKRKIICRTAKGVFVKCTYIVWILSAGEQSNMRQSHPI